MKKISPYHASKLESFLWNRLSTGDKDSFEIFFKTCYLKLCAFSNRFTKNMDDAREVVQELFVWLWENRERIKEVQSVQSYIYAALRYNSIRKFKSRSTGAIEIADVPDHELAVDFQNELEYAELQEAILEAIDSLPPQCQKIFRLSRFEKQTYQEIAGRLNISPRTVEAQMRKALQILQKALEALLPAFIFFLFSIKK